VLEVPTAWLLKVRLRLAGEIETVGTAPVPVKVTVCVVGLALSVMVRTPLTVLAPVGVNVTLIVQLPPAAMPVPQLAGDAEKLLAPVVTRMLVKVRVAVPELVTVTV
jgi:hypothetical protein